MANTCTSSRKRSKGLPRAPQFGLWLWCIIIKCLISLPCIFSSCQGVNISVAMYPEGMTKLQYGEPLEILCVAEKDTAENLVFQINGKRIHSDIVNSTTRRLYIEKLEKNLYTYYCKNLATGKICTSRVLVDSPPSYVNDFGCISKNLEKLYCSWTCLDLYSYTNYSLSFAILGNVAEPCIATKTDMKRSCEWTTNSRPRYQQMENQYYFYLKSCNYFGCILQNFTVDHFSIVKPDAPDKLKVLRKDAHSVLLQWNIPNNIVDFLKCPVVHRIEYQIAKIDNTTHFRSVDTSNLPPRNDKTYKFRLSNLPYAHMQYEVRIYIKSALATEEKFWSDFTYTVFYTASEKPKRPPDTITGAFYQSLFDDKRVIYVYWRQLEEYEEAGANFTYKVVATQGLKNPQTLHPDKNKSLSYIILNDASLEAIDISIWSTNANGSSDNSSHLYIPAKRDTEALEVKSFTKLAYENGTYKLSWVGLENIDNYTLFWCHHNTTQICAGQMNFMVLNDKKNSHVIHLPTDSRYQFAISANNGSKTSGMIWASCDISKDLIPMYGFPVRLNHDAPGKTHVKLTWTMSCTLQEGVITGYLILYCPVLDTSNKCDPTFGNKSMYNIADPKTMEVNITDLKPYRTYQFWLVLNTTYGLKTIENASTGVTTLEDTPSSPRNVAISDVYSESLIISWDPPLHKNGIIGKYVIFKNDQEFLVEKVPDKDNTRRTVTLTGLNGFTNYSFSVQACNTAIQSCSAVSPPNGIFVRTRIGHPSKMDPPIVKFDNHDVLMWNPPKIPGGTIDQYQIMRVRDQDPAETWNTTDLSYALIRCQGIAEDETYQVRAINFDEDPYHGTLADKVEVILPMRLNNSKLEFSGEWSLPHTVTCRSKGGVTMTLSLLAVFVIIGIGYCSLKLYKKYRKMEDIKPVLPNGLGIPEKDISKYAFGGWNPTNKDEKPSSDEVLLLPNSRITASAPENKKNNENNSGASDNTDSTMISDTSRAPVERQASTSDDGSDSSLNLEMEPVRIGDNNVTPEEEEVEASNSDSEISRQSSPYFSEKDFRKKPTTGYTLPVVSLTTGYTQAAPVPHHTAILAPAAQSASSSYVMAGISEPIFTTGVAPPSLTIQPPASPGYVRPEDIQAKSKSNFPKLGPSSMNFDKLFGPESLPSMPTLPQSVQQGADSSYIQLQSLDTLPRSHSHKQPVRNVTLMPTTQASNGYVVRGDAVMNKHLNNMISSGQLSEESAILDPAMSPDAYCRFSWSTDPANDNLHSLLNDSLSLNSSKN